AIETEPASEVVVVPTHDFSLISEEDRMRLPQDIGDAYPLTMLQWGMLFHMQLTPELSLYHNVASLFLKMRLEPELFQRAVNEVVQRHPILRTSFDMVNYSRPLQLVHQAAFLQTDVTDISDLNFAEQDKTVEAFIEEE